MLCRRGDVVPGRLAYSPVRARLIHSFEGSSMRDEAAFLEAIREDPNDDAARLVYADWLDEQGDSRCEYLRLEHQLSQTAQRLGELQRTIEPGWLADVRRPPPGADARWGSLSLTLDCGRRVTLDAFEYSRTYGGLLEGLPNAEINSRI